MLPLLQKRSKAQAGPAVPAWHPNFRDYEKLPDVKVVRTAFFMNGAAIAVALALAIYFGLHEWQLHAINVQLAVTQQQIDRDKRPSDEAVALFKRFQAEEKKMAAVDGFVHSRPNFAALLLRVSTTLPENIALDSFDLRAIGVSLRLTVKGTPEDAAGYATAYYDQLRADKELVDIDRPKIEFTHQSRNPNTGLLNVEFLLRLKPELVEKGK